MATSAHGSADGDAAAGAVVVAGSRTNGYVDTSRAIADAPPGKWEAFGRAVLAFHRRMGATAMCVCGRTWRECDVWRQAEQYGIRQLPASTRPGGTGPGSRR